MPKLTITGNIVTGSSGVIVTEPASAVRTITIPEWQPIETAPKNGSHALLTHIGISEVMIVGLWQEGRWCDAYNGCPIILQPTHWMNLPAPPGDAPNQIRSTSLGVL